MILSPKSTLLLNQLRWKFQISFDFPFYAMWEMSKSYGQYLPTHVTRMVEDPHSLNWSTGCARSRQYLLIYLYQTCTQKFLLNWKDICLRLYPKSFQFAEKVNKMIYRQRHIS